MYSCYSVLGSRKLHILVYNQVIYIFAESMLDIEEPTLMDDIIVAIVDFFQVLIRLVYTVFLNMLWATCNYSYYIKTLIGIVLIKIIYFLFK